MADAVAVFSEIQESDKATIQFDERRAITANRGSAAWLRVAVSASHIYITGNMPPGPWYRLRRGKRGLYRIPRTSVESIKVLSDRNLSTAPFIWLILFADFRARGSGGLVNGLVIAGFAVTAIASWFLVRRFGLRLYTSDGFFYSVTETGFGNAKVKDGLEWASRLRAALKSAGWPVASS